MTKDQKCQLISATDKAFIRVSSRIIGLQNSYIITLRTRNIALRGHDELKKELDDLEEGLKLVGMSYEEYYLSILFLDLVSEMEIYFSSLIKAVISKYPKKLGSTKFSLAEVIDTTTIDDLITKAADEYVNNIMYKKPMEYLDSMVDVLSVEKNGIIEDWKVFVEAKARRDLGVHNSWICNLTYLRKTKEVGWDTDAKVGDSMIPLYDDYVDNLLDRFKEISLYFDFQINVQYA
jgi:hypothetical protein